MVLFSSCDFFVVFPEIFLTLCTCFCLFIFSRGSSEPQLVYFYCALLLKPLAFFLCLQTVFFTFLLTINCPVSLPEVFFGFIFSDFFSVFGKALLSFFVFFFLFCCEFTFKSNSLFIFEFFILVLFGLLSMLLIVSSADFLSLYLSLELQALSFYVLACFSRHSSYSTEAGLKYFIVGAFASGILLFGLSLIYGFLGTTSYNSIALLLGCFSFYNYGLHSLPIFFGFGLILTSFFFKLAAAPFHFWAVDVYEGCPLVSAFFFSLLPKIALTFALSRLCFYSFFEVHDFWQLGFLVSGLLSIAFGSLGAVYQKKIRRFIVLSSVVHIGFIFVSIGSGTVQGFLAAFFYLFVYSVISLCFWSLLSVTQTSLKSFPVRYVTNFFWIGKQNFFFSLALSIVLFSIAGVPPLAGFGAKLFVFFSMVDSGFFLPAFFTLGFSVVGCFYYLRIVKILFFEQHRAFFSVVSLVGPVARFSWASSFTVSFSAFLCLFLYVMPGSLLLLVHLGASSFVFLFKSPSSSDGRAKD